MLEMGLLVVVVVGLEVRRVHLLTSGEDVIV